MSVKRIAKSISFFFFLCLMTVSLGGCGLMPFPSQEDSLTAENDVLAGQSADTEASERVTVGSYLSIEDIDNRLQLLDNKDALSADGLYYAAWTIGDSIPYENSEGDTVDLYDAQLYLLAGEFKDAQTAQNNMDLWLAAGKENYDVTEEKTITCNGCSYTLINYNCVNEENPYARGTSAFGVYKDSAVCIELTCREQFIDDLESILTDFLEHCVYAE
ncbi:MAG: hypothetical protein NC314_03405 [Roseburia sp.]|nr:hypothetical protein [Roseburia sp.]MCM1241861.1 hypothetical protein [Roseburia sp.]